ncbi:hypothetical protein AWL63_23390 (plasmid) [Sphingomonas panacis]|uniref:Uncharacterized protein n=1 Tax=Sphingomonas panacis TaxID=1560345 RepID=A0A1B3ZI74_9SPHN|nr:hypothetical protein [Sphingomonas panacis]AOH87122.1 hypothetical protein AWL63_23390 [Sphingomonas panacis]
MRPLDLDAEIIELVACQPPAAPALNLREMAFRKDSWAPAEVDELRRLFDADQSLDQIAQALRRGRFGIADKIAGLGLRRNSTRPWSGLEDDDLTRQYGCLATAQLALLFGRTCAAIYARASILGLTDGAPPAWTAWEDAQLREGYRLAVPLQQLCTLIGRPLTGLSARAAALGLRHPNHPSGWSDAEAGRALELAEAGNRYRAIIEQLAAEGFPRRSLAGLGPQIRRLGYGRGWGRPWGPDEDALLVRAYAEGSSLTPVRTRLGRTTCSIRWRSEYLGLRGSHANRNGWRTAPDWSEADLTILREEYGRTPTRALAARFGRTKASITTRANVLGLVHGYIRPWTKDEMAALANAFHHGIAIADLAAALTRKPASVSKFATKHGFDFGRRALRGEAPTLLEIIALSAPQTTAV